MLFTGGTGFVLLNNGIKDLENVLLFLSNIFYYILNLLGYSTGTVINKSADVLGDTAIIGIDIAEGTAHDVGDLFIKSSNIDESINKETFHSYIDNNYNILNIPSYPNPDNSGDPIQNPISSNKNKWCLVGEYQQKRGCIKIEDSDKCMSGKMSATKEICLQMK